MNFLDLILGQNWRFYSHERLHEMVRGEAEGPKAVAEVEEAWRDFAALMTDCRDRTEQLLREAGASWVGLAGDSMAAGVTPLAQWAEEAGTAGAFSSASVSDIAGAFAHTSNAMPEPVRVTSTANEDFGGIPGTFTHIFGGQTDQDRQERAAQQAKEQAVHLMESYASTVDLSVAAVGVFVPPQGVLVNAAEPDSGSSGGDRPVGRVGGIIERGGRLVDVGEPQAPRPSVDEGEPDSGTDPSGVGPGPVPAEVVRPVDVVRPAAGVSPASAVENGSSTRADLAVGGSGAGSGRGPGRGSGDGVGGGVGRGSRGGSGRGGGGLGAGGGADGRMSVGRDAVVVRGPGAIGSTPQGIAAVTSGQARGVSRGGLPGVVAPTPGVQSEKDGEHVGPEYLKEYHDEFWDSAPAPSPPVIGLD